MAGWACTGYVPGMVQGMYPGIHHPGIHHPGYTAMPRTVYTLAGTAMRVHAPGRNGALGSEAVRHIWPWASGQVFWRPGIDLRLVNGP